MDKTESTIFYNGQFWIALVERIRNGKTSYAKYTFGPEPTNPQILNFYLNIYPRLIFLGELPEKINCTKRKPVPQKQTALDRYKELEKGRLENRKKETVKKKNEDKVEQFRLKQLRKKEKKRGH